MRELLCHPREIATVIGLTAGGTLAFYTYTTYMQKYLVNTSGLSKSDATLVSAITLLLFMLMPPLVGLLSDKIGRRPVLITFGVLGTLAMVQLLTALSTVSSIGGAITLITTALLIVSGYTAINAVVKAELLPARIRTIGVALPYALIVSIFGGSAEYLALWFKSIGHEEWFYWYVTVMIGISLLVYATMKDRRDHSRIETD